MPTRVKMIPSASSPDVTLLRDGRTFGMTRLKASAFLVCTLVVFSALSMSPAHSVAQTRRTIDWANVRTIIVFGPTRDDTHGSPSLLEWISDEVHVRLSNWPGLLSLESRDVTRALGREIRRRRLPRTRVEATLTELTSTFEGSRVSVRASVSVVLLEDPGTRLRGAAGGTATRSDSTVGDTEALFESLRESAVRGATERGLSDVLETYVLR